jgi:hypothetical protein
LDYQHSLISDNSVYNSLCRFSFKFFSLSLDIMPTKPKRPRDPNQLAYLIGEIATGSVEEEQAPDTRNPAAVALGELGAAKGGKARAKALNKTERSAIAKKAAKARWKKKK